MTSLVRPELPTAALRSSQATLAAVDNSAPLATRPQPTYKSGKVVQTNGATSFDAILRGALQRIHALSSVCLSVTGGDDGRTTAEMHEVIFGSVLKAA